MQSRQLKLNSRNVGILGLILVLVVVGVMFGFTAVRVVAGMLVLFFLPMYLILRSFALDQDERIFISFFLGLGVVPIIVFYVNKIISSFRLSILVTFLVLTGVGIAMIIFKRKK